jgi:protein-tyrosine sulfotransferase
MRNNLINWNKLIKNMYSQCISIKDRCLPVYYEQLVLHPEAEIRKVLKFLEIPWSDTVFNFLIIHSKFYFI